MPPSNIYQNQSVPSPVAEPANVTPPVTNVTPITNVTPVTNAPPVEVPKPKRKFSKLFIALGLLVLLVIISAVALLFANKNKSTNSGAVTWWGLWEDQSIVAPLISSYEASHPGVKINYVSQSKEDYRERLANAFTKGNGPDIFTFHNTWAPMFKSDFDALPSSIMTAADYSKTFYSVITSDLSSGNSIIGIPLGYDSLALYINQDIFDKTGKSAPTTWDDLRSLAKQLTIKDDKGSIVQSGIALGRTENVDHWQEILALLMLQNGVDLNNPVGKNAEDALTFFTLFSTDDGVWDSTLPTSTQAFESGKLAMYIAPSWRAFEIQAKNPNLKFRTVPIPQLPKDSPTDQDVTYATYWAQGVWSKSSNKTAAWNFLNYLVSTDSLQKLYQNESATRSFGEPYPRIEMADLLKDHPIIGSIISQAPGARSWYLASRTFDGETGINTQISNYFGDAVNSVVSGDKTATEALSTVAQGVAQVLSKYNISVK